MVESCVWFNDLKERRYPVAEDRKHFRTPKIWMTFKFANSITVTTTVIYCYHCTKMIMKKNNWEYYYTRLYIKQQFMNTHTILKMKSKILGPCKMSCGIQRRSLSQSLVYFYCYKSSGRFGVKHFCTVTSWFDFNCTVPNTFYRFFFIQS